MLIDVPSKHSSASFAFPSSPSPRTADEWKLALKGVKLLYLKRQYKQCAKRSMEILKAAKGPIHPICKTYLYFYAATSSEFLGRAAHLYSGNKVSLFHSALDHFVACSAALPTFIDLPSAKESPPPTPAKDTLLSFNGAEYQSLIRESLVRSITSMIDTSLFGPEDDPFVSDPEPSCQPSAQFSPLQFPLDAEDPVNKDRLLPSPLRIRKPSSETRECGSRNMDDKGHEVKIAAFPNPPGRSQPPLLPLKIVPASRLNIGSQKASRPTTSPPSKRTLSAHNDNVTTLSTTKQERKLTRNESERGQEPITPARAAAIAQFNDSIEFLRLQIASNIASLQTEVDRITEMQRARRARNMQRSASFWSFSPVKPGEESESTQGQEQVIDQLGHPLRKETKEQRIARLRAEGWNTVGLRSSRRKWKGSEYYEAYCNTVLEELYLDA